MFELPRQPIRPRHSATDRRPDPLPRRPPLRRVIGVDFSGAAQSGKTAWLAECEVLESGDRLRLVDLKPLGRLAGDDARHSVNEYLVQRILASPRGTLFGMDFPFGLPMELELGPWEAQLATLQSLPGTAKDLGRALVARTETLVGSMHARRQTDQETSTPFDCYHYRIIYQTFHGMRDVLAPIASDPQTMVLPFQYERTDVKRVVMEACPSSTLARLSLPRRMYKQSAGKSPEPSHQQVRRKILRCIESFVQWTSHRRQVMMRDSGGDALDALLAAVGSWQAYGAADHEAIWQSPRYRFEGHVYA
ncbi:MAG: DUF429 domain-containing protein [Planctomycetota bacterium]